MEVPFSIRQWLIEPQLNKVSGPTGSFSIEPRTMKVLVLLAQETPGVVTREQIMDVVWEGSIVTEHSLTIAISDLRKIFGDDPKSPAVIETIRGVGYRLIAPVVEGSAVAPSRVDIAQTPTLSVPHQGDGIALASTPPGSRIPREAVWGIALLALLVIAAGFFFWPSQDHLAIQKIQPLTTMAGVELSPVFSPDSRRVAFVAFPDTGGIADIFIKQMGANTPVRFTDERGAELLPTWSPDGQFIIYQAYGQTGCALYKKPSFGGSSMKLREISCQLSGMSWSPAGNAFVLSMYDGDLGANRLYEMSLEDYELLPITTPTAPINGDLSPRFSPDGQNLAFLRNIDGVTQDLYLINWQEIEVEPLRLTHDEVQITGFDWAADGEAMVFASRREEQNGIWYMELKKPNQPTLIRAISVEDPGSVALAPSGKQLIYTDWTFDVNIWRKSLSNETSVLQPALVSTRTDFHPHISSRGKVAFISSRTGTNEVWVSDLDGNNVFQVTSLSSKSTRHPVWSPDGTMIAFDSHSNGHTDIFVVDAEGGMPRQITTEKSRDVRPTWSRDGQQVYFSSNRTGAWQLWKYSLIDETVTQVTEGGGTVGWETQAGDKILYIKYDSTGVWEKSFEDGSERLLLNADPSFISLAGNHVYYIAPMNSVSSYSIMRYDLNNQDTEKVAVIPNKPYNFFSRWGFAISPDEQWLYVSQIDKSESDLMLTE